VYLVGAGPGDPGLVTVRALELIRRAEVLAYDRLIPPGLIELAPAGCELVDVGKRPDVRREQGDISELLVERARAGKVVVRLKGGDPFVFGRGGEEAEACVEAGVRFEVVPGVTSAVAAAAYAGVPLTHRGLSQSFTVVTGHGRADKPGVAVDWELLPRGGTLCVLMAVGRLGWVAERLIATGRAPDTPAVLVERGTFPDQRVIRSTLEKMPADAEAAGAKAPALLVVGEVAALADRLAWTARRPLAGQVVLVPRAREQAGALAALLRERGASPLEAPLIDVHPPERLDELDAAVERLAAGEFAWTVLTSGNGVAALRARVEALGRDARALAGTRLAAVGPATEAALRAWGLTADLVPATATGTALGAAFPPGSGPVLLLRGDLAAAELPAALAAKGWAPVDVVAYRTVPRTRLDPGVRASLDAGGCDWVAFTSPSTLTGFLTAYGGPPPPGVKVAAIGPVTAEAVQASGIGVDALAREHSAPGLVAAIEDAVRGCAVG
jgi:uroporphyrinogen III methyltransferase / synthase